jgi:hypothetical protein
MSGPIARMVYRLRNQWEEIDEPIIFVGNSLLAISACAPQPPPPPAVAAAPAPGSPTNTTTAFDGTYDGSFVQSITPGSPTAQCPNIRVAPVLTIRNGIARFAALNLTFQGYVTPQGALMMQSEGGQTFEGKIDPNFVLKGRVSGNCIYDATWTKHQSPRG